MSNETPQQYRNCGCRERFHETILQNFRTLVYVKKEISVKRMIQQSIRNYNERYHSTIKYTPNEIQTHKANLNKGAFEKSG